jgi:hypothetical protein
VWTPPGGELAERRQPSAYLRRIWAQAAGKRLAEAIDAAWGGTPDGLPFQGVVVRGESGPSLVGVADSAHDLLVVGAGRRGGHARRRLVRVRRLCRARAGRCRRVPPADLARAGGRLRGHSGGELALTALSELDGAKPSRNR